MQYTVISTLLIMQQLIMQRATANDVPVTPKPCKDTLSAKSCRRLSEHRVCLSHKKRMKVFCPYTCGFCKRTGKLECQQTPFGCCPDRVTPAKGRRKWGCPEKCADELNVGICRSMKRSGICQSKSNYKMKCLRTCQMCRKCVDKSPKRCRHIVKYKLCHKKKSIAMNTCRKSCSFCGESDPCYKFFCKKDRTCRVDHNGKPFCACDRKCHHGDHHTGMLCGSDGKEYDSLCKLKNSDCSNVLTVVNYGKCMQANVVARRLFKRGISMEAFCNQAKDKPHCHKLSLSRSVCQLRRVMKKCPHACGFCYKGTPCQNTEYGCCPNGISAAKSRNGGGCLAKKRCRDQSPRFCKRFVPTCGHSKYSMIHYCYKTCHYCV